MISHRHDPLRLVPWDEMVRDMHVVQLQIARENHELPEDARRRAERILEDIESGRPMRYERRKQLQARQGAHSDFSDSIL